MASRIFYVDFHFHAAITDGDLDSVRYHLTEPGIAPSLNALYDGSTPLTRACMAGQSDIVELLLQHGAEPWRLDKDGLTPMTYALMAKDPNERHTMAHAIGTALLQCGRDPVATSAPGVPLEGYAESYWQDALPFYGCHDLQFVAHQYDDPALIKLLWSFECNYVLQQLHYRNPGSDSNDLQQLYEIALEKKRITDISGHGTALFVAAVRGHSATLQALMQCGFRNYGQGKHGISPLEVADHHEDLAMSEMIKSLDSQPILHQHSRVEYAPPVPTHKTAGSKQTYKPLG